MQRFVFRRVVRFLEYRNVVGAAFVEVFVIVGVDRVDFHADDPEILAGDLDGVSDVLNVRHLRAFAGQHEDFFDAGVGDVLAFAVELFVVQAGPLDFIVGVEAAVDAVVVAVVGKINRREDGNVGTEMAARHDVGLLGHLFQIRSGGRRQEGHEVPRFQVLLIQGPFDVLGRIVFVMEGVVVFRHFVEHVRIKDFHARKIGHVVNALFCHRRTSLVAQESCQRV